MANVQQILTSYFTDHNKFRSIWALAEEITDLVDDINKTAPVYIKLLNCQKANKTVSYSRVSESDNYLKVADFQVTPQLLDHDCLTFADLILADKARTIKIHYMVSEKWGISLHSKYAPSRVGFGVVSQMFLFYPDIIAEISHQIPPEIIAQVYDIVLLLYKNNISLNDIHLGNFVEKDGLVKVIDLEDMSTVIYDPTLSVENSLTKEIKIMGGCVRSLRDAYDAGARDVTEALQTLFKSNKNFNNEEYQFLRNKLK